MLPLNLPENLHDLEMNLELASESFSVFNDITAANDRRPRYPEKKKMATLRSHVFIPLCSVEDHVDRKGTTLSST